MKKYMLDKSMRFFFFGAGMVIWLGIYLTGYDVVHWFSYFPAAFFLLAAITGICPGIIFSRMLFGKN